MLNSGACLANTHGQMHGEHGSPEGGSSLEMARKAKSHTIQRNPCESERYAIPRAENATAVFLIFAPPSSLQIRSADTIQTVADEFLYPLPVSVPMQPTGYRAVPRSGEPRKTSDQSACASDQNSESKMINPCCRYRRLSWRHALLAALEWHAYNCIVNGQVLHL